MTTENTHHPIELTAAEISSLWASYQNDTLNICAIRFFLIHVDDPQIHELLEEALKIAKESKIKTEQIFNHENHPVPQGFTNKDVNFKAPRLFADKMYLHYVLNITNLNTTAETTAITMAARSDIIDFYSNKLKSIISERAAIVIAVVSAVVFKFVILRT